MIFALFGLVCFISGTAGAVAIDDNTSAITIQKELIAWVRSKGGIFSDKLSIRRVDPEDPKSYMGIFVEEAIGAKESLFLVPRNCYIDVFDTASEMDPEDENVEAAYVGNLCQLSKKLATEMDLREKSGYAPYIAYLKTQQPGQLPVNWSKEGKDLLRKVAFPGSPMVDWIDRNFMGEKNNCFGKPKKSNSKDISFEEHIIEMTVQRCYDTALIPIWDMVNHDNGKINTENDSMHEPIGLKVRAARDLEKGEEIFATYDKCLDCKGVEEYWGTPEILKDFGFVENYPHRWVFTDQNIWFQIYKDYEFDAYFGDTNQSTTPSKEQLDFLEKELDRLELLIEDVVLAGKGNVPEREWRTVQKYHEVAVIDLDVVVEWYSGDQKDEL